MQPAVGLRPGFGQADLSNCEREQIHLAGSIQPHGALLVVDEPDQVIVQASVNAAEFLRVPAGLVGSTLESLGGTLAAAVAPHRHAGLHDFSLPLRCELGDPPARFDCFVHRPPDGGLVIELERTGPAVDLSQQLADALQIIVACPSLRALCDETAGFIRKLTGYDRVMVYRFDEDGHGEVFSEERRADLEAFLGNRYPASDIPQIARRLYERNRVRVLVDINYDAVPIAPRMSPITGRDLDMSLSMLRSMSPIHVQYLKNMGVGATLVISLVVGGKLWGLIACHHYQPRAVHLEVRAACEALAEAIATRIAALESFVRAQAELAVRRLEQRMVEAIGRDGDWRSALFDNAQTLLNPVGATGAALLFDGQVLTVGDVPATAQLREIGKWLDRTPRQPEVATNSLPSAAPEFESLLGVATGLMATAVSNSPGEYLLWFRPEQVQTVTWGGNPFKPFVVGSDPSELSPRRSFAQWHQLVEGTSEPWTPADRAAARLIGESVTDVVVQFRAVRILLARSQLDAVSRDVRLSEQPVIITDPRGRILLANEAFERLLKTAHPHVEWIEDLSPFFVDAGSTRERFRSVIGNRQSWRGELLLRTEAGAKPLHLRADPIVSGPEQLLGFVLLFADLTERKAADAARRSFQEGTIGKPRTNAVQLGSSGDLLYRKLLATVLENAQLAALEITDGIDTARMPEMLESVRASVARTAEILAQFIEHARTEDAGPKSSTEPRGRSKKASPPAVARANGRQPPEQLPKS